MKITFIVNGTETIVKANKKEKLQVAAGKALRKTGNIGRPISDFQAFLDDTNLNLDCAIDNQVKRTDKGGRIENEKLTINKSVVLFLSIRSGSGGGSEKCTKCRDTKIYFPNNQVSEACECVSEIHKEKAPASNSNYCTDTGKECEHNCSGLCKERC